MDLTMVNTAERHREFVAHFATERTKLRETKMMWIRGLTATNQAGLRGNKLAMGLVTDAARLADRKQAFVDASFRVVELTRDCSRIASVQPGTRPGDVAQPFGSTRAV